MSRLASGLLAILATACGANASAPPAGETATRGATSSVDPTVDPSTFTGKQVRGPLEPEQIRTVVLDHLHVFRECYDDARRVSPKLQGKVTVKFEVDADGVVTKSADARSDLPDASVVQCVVDAYRTLRFPKPNGGGIVTVYFPLIFNPRD